MSSFQRLIRFASPTGQIYYGEAPSTPYTPCASDLIGAKVRIYTGNPTSSVDVHLSDDEAEVAEVLSPLEQVPIIYGIGLNYRKHVLEAKFPIPEFPVLFTKPPDALADPYEDIPIDPQLQNLDYEGELCFVVGQDVKDFAATANPAPFILGYTAGNDISSRYWQMPPRSGQQHGYAKSFDKFAPLGPLLVSPAAIADPTLLTLKTWVNGEERQSAGLDDLIFGVADILAHLSRGTTVRRGTVVMTGTPGGVGMFWKGGSFLKDGDEVEIEVQQVGRLKNRMVWRK